MRLSVLSIGISVVLVAVGNAYGQGSRGTRLSSPECIDPSRLVVQYDPAPARSTFMRVQHMGDAGTVEQAQQVAHVVTWDVGQLSGLHASPAAQRGYQDQGLPVGTSAFQLDCLDAGFVINTWQFKHSLPLVGEGPSVTLGRSFEPPVPFNEGMVMSMDARVPWILNQRPPVADGTAQLSFLYYVRDRKSGRALAHVIALFENRPLGVGGSGVEFFGDDGITAFASSPLRATDATGAAVEFISPPTAGEMQFVQPWSEWRHFQAVVTDATLGRMLAKLRLTRPEFSAEPADYEIIFFGVLAEVFPGTGDADNVSFAGSMRGVTLDEFRYAFRRNRVPR